MTQRTLIEARDVTRTYRKDGAAEVRALDGVSLQIRAGELVALVGASGSGKSTLMNILGCLDRPTSGSVLLDGHEVSALDDDALAEVRSMKVGFVFQSFNLLPRTSALENVQLPLLYTDRSDIVGPARDALRAVGLPEDRYGHHPGELSGGQQQRVAIARALVNDPEILFADEPTGNLDSTSSGEIMTLFTELNRRGRTVVLVTHDAEVARYARRVLTIRDGRIVSDRAGAEIGAGEELARAPAAVQDGGGGLESDTPAEPGTGLEVDR
ncbi:MAG: ABC transporter ATP-binding protein [Gemmatimonadota bacterium]